MVTAAKAIINPALLIWARESAGMPPDEACARLKIKLETFLKWESGESAPTIKQLRNLAGIYKQSFAAFYLPKPPEVFLPPVKDFRRFAGNTATSISSALMLDLRLSLERRDILLELLSERKQPPLELTAIATLTDDPENVALRIREILEISTNITSKWKDNRTVFNGWREAIENQGVLVFQSKRLSLSEMRGYSIAEFPLPIIVVNRKDAYSARVFSLLHEFTHLLLGISGLCDINTDIERAPEEQKLEVFCNHVAGAALIPKNLLLADQLVINRDNSEFSDLELEKLAKKFGTSREAVLRRLLIFNRTTVEFYRKKRQQFSDEAKVQVNQKSGFVTPAIDTISTAGKPFIREVLSAYFNENITSVDASDYLGVKTQHFGKISRAVGF